MTGLIIKDTNLLGQKNRGLGHPPEAGITAPRLEKHAALSAYNWVCPQQLLTHLQTNSC